MQDLNADFFRSNSGTDAIAVYLTLNNVHTPMRMLRLIRLSVSMSFLKMFFQDWPEHKKNREI